ncbi:type IV toxin-antitoxin system AbiEi family antitoxin [Erwiniaceae bacterium L1_54_6]|nr:type IV toxin-antitoxin system AbiEi family antitoxin [Erwiniaceae bacterium L1_54_6]
MNEELLLSEAIENLADGFTLTYADRSQGAEPDYCAELIGPNGERVHLKLEVKYIHRKQTLLTAKERMKHDTCGLPWLLVCNRLTPDLAAFCASQKINFLDSAGNTRIQVPGLYLIVEGRYEKKTVSSGRKMAEGVMKLLFVLLSDPDTLNNTYRRLAELSGISLGMVSKAFDYLENQRYYRKAQGGRRLMKEEELVALWINDYTSALRPKLKQLYAEFPESWEQLALLPDEYSGGEIVAAELSEGYLFPSTGIVYTPHPLLQRRKELGLKPVRHGGLQLITCFWGSFKLNDRARTILCMAELLGSGDDRNREVARIINDKYLNLNESTLFSY